MTRVEVVQKAIAGEITWQQAASICRLSARHMRRLRWQYEELGPTGLRDGRRGRSMPRKVSVKTVEKICKLKRDKYADFSTQHFHEFLTEKHGVDISYTWTLMVLQAHGLVTKAKGRGKYRRKRERRPMTGMLLHLDGSVHEWIEKQPKQFLIAVVDDADGRLLFGQFFEQENTMAIMSALDHVLKRYGRFCELYTDRASHFCHTPIAGEPSQEAKDGQVSRVCRTLGIRQIWARSPQARGRSERAFGTIQGRLPQELELAGIRNYEAANRYLSDTFNADFNKRFTVKPMQAETAFIPIVGLELTLLLSIHHERTVRNDNTVTFMRRTLQLPSSTTRAHYARCKVTVHGFPDGTLGISHQNQLLERYSEDGEPLKTKPSPKKRARRAS